MGNSELTFDRLKRMMQLVELGSEMPDEWKVIRLGEKLYEKVRSDWIRRAKMVGANVPTLTFDETGIEMRLIDVRVVKDKNFPPDVGLVMDDKSKIVAFIRMEGRDENCKMMLIEKGCDDDTGG